MIFITDKKGKDLVLTSPEEFLLVKADGMYCFIYTVEMEKYKVKMPLRDIFESLKEVFIRCHKGYLVNPKYIKLIDVMNSEIELKIDNVRIPISRRILQDIKRDALII